MNCGWCDNEFDTDDWIEDGERECEDCDQRFCSERCQQEHNDGNHTQHECNSAEPQKSCSTCEALVNVSSDLAAIFGEA